MIELGRKGWEEEIEGREEGRGKGGEGGRGKERGNGI